MNREIKFRAWDTERKIFVPQGEIVFCDYGETAIEVHPNDMLYVGDSCHNGEPQRSRFIVSQYTGLKDKNGKEIYEGDVCKISDPYNENEKTFAVEYSNGGFAVEWHSMFCGGEADMTTIGWAMDSEFSIEVIGNIYENPELINPKF